MISLNNVTKSHNTKHGRHYVFRDVSIVFPERKNIGILGPNGAGKTTLLRLIGKADYPDKGEVIVTDSVSWPVGLSSGFQGSLTGRDNAHFICKIYGVNGAEMERRIAFVEEFADIGKYFDLPVNTYSTGMRARVNFGLSMAFDFDYYMVDEITAVGDAVFKKKSTALFREKREKANIIIVSHQMEKLREICDVGLLIDNGHIQYFEDIKDAIKEYAKL